MRILGLDYGTKTVGAAVTDPLGITVQPLETITRDADNKIRPTLRRIEEIIETMDVGEIVVGLPLNMDGSEGERAARSREFADAIERRTGISVRLLDERLTTVEAEKILDECGITKKDYKRYVDSVAAVLILEDYVRNCC